MSSIEVGIECLRRGRPIFIYDFDEREKEIDVVVRADYVTPELIRWIRKNAGGLICFVTSEDVGKKLGIDFMTNYLKMSNLELLLKKPSYGDDPAFSIYVNHVNTRTGIRDKDRALTISRLAHVVKLAVNGNMSEAREVFRREFYTPGHVPILLGRVGKRFGHTELSLILAELAKIPPALVITEMLSDDGEALSKEDILKISQEMNTVVITGDEILKYVGYVK
ncbi:MAG: 3,4-dihydroxy-2-butanone 4-phosphate synthase [Thermoprotei archaeon ex4572_64]|nr:MAG: 3,4-dihydroxy-2-butanone 4-phosphate synthase [Thermoprotei archaeon ex4572_64]